MNFDGDNVPVKVSAERVRLLEAWLKEQGLPPLREVNTPQGEACLAHDAEILDRFDRSHLHLQAECEREDQTSRVLGDHGMKTVLYLFPKEEAGYQKHGDRPAGPSSAEFPLSEPGVN